MLPPGTTHHCPLASRGNCNRIQPTGRRKYCKTHQVLCGSGNSKCLNIAGFIPETDICGKCHWMHPRHKEFARQQKDKNAQATKVEQEKKLRAKADKEKAAKDKEKAAKDKEKADKAAAAKKARDAAAARKNNK